jgi:hypothetical protein
MVEAQPSPDADLVAAWDGADGAQRTKLLAGLFERIEAQPGGGVRVVAVPRDGWRRFFEYATYSAVEVRYRLAGCQRLRI